MCTVTASLDGVGACPINAAPSIGGTRHEPVDPCPFSASRGVIVLAPCLLSSLHPAARVRPVERTRGRENWKAPTSGCYGGRAWPTPERVAQLMIVSDRLLPGSRGGGLEPRKLSCLVGA